MTALTKISPRAVGLTFVAISAPFLLRIDGFAIWLVPLATLLIIFLSRRAALGLALGTLMGAYHLADYSPLTGMSRGLGHYMAGAFTGIWHVSALVFTLVLGAFAGVMQAGGGFQALAHHLTREGQVSPRRIESATAGLGILCFFDGLANSLLVGQVARPLFDRAAIPRARLAYLVDSTSSAVACVAFISTWIAMQLSLIQDGITEAGLSSSAYGLFFRSIPQNYYCIFSLATVAIVISRQWMLGPMKSERAQTPELESKNDSPAPLNAALGPLAVLIISILGIMYFWDTDRPFAFSLDKFVAAFGGNAGPYALMLGSTAGLVTALAWAPSERKRAALRGASHGALGMIAPLAILIAAWSFGSMLADLGTAQWLADGLLSSLSPQLFPLAIFLTASVISVCTGSSWGTMGLVMPIALGGWQVISPGDEAGMVTAIAAVFSGAVFGDHCSPFSDTTVVSSFASGVTTDTHVKTQAPYALVTAGVTAVFGFGGAAVGCPPLLCLILGIVFLYGLVRLAT